MNDAEREARERLVRAEYLEMPGLKLTAVQASRFWHLGPSESEALLDALVGQGVLVRTRDGHYILLAGSHLR
jgi:hypothetical protein